MKKYRDSVLALLDKEYESPLTGPTNSLILASSKFVAEIKDRFRGARQPERDFPGLQKNEGHRRFVWVTPISCVYVLMTWKAPGFLLG